MNELMKILIVEVSQNKSLTGTFKAKPRVTIVTTDFENKENLDDYI